MMFYCGAHNHGESVIQIDDLISTKVSNFFGMVTYLNSQFSQENGLVISREVIHYVVSVVGVSQDLGQNI